MNHPDQGPPLPCMEYCAALSHPQPGDDNNNNNNNNNNIIHVIMLWLVTVCRPAKAFIILHPDVCTAIIIIIKTEVIPMVVGVLGTVKTRMVENRKHQESIRESYCDRDPKDLSAGNARILRRMFSVWSQLLTWVADAPGAWFVPGWCTKRTPAKSVTEEIIIKITIIILIIVVTKGSVKGFYHVVLLKWRPCEKLR